MRILGVVLALVCATATVRADTETEALARAHFTTGRSYYDQARYEDALKEFQEAYRLSKRVGFLYNIGVCHEQLGHDDDALNAYKGYLLSVSEAGERTEIEQRIQRLEDKKRAAAKPVPARAMPEPTPSVVVAAPAPRPRPIYKRGWFWGVMGGAAAVLVGGVVAGVVVGTANHGSNIRTIGDVRLAP